MEAETKNEKAVETQVPTESVVMAGPAPRLLGGLSLKTRIRAGKKAASLGT